MVRSNASLVALPGKTIWYKISMSMPATRLPLPHFLFMGHATKPNQIIYAMFSDISLYKDKNVAKTGSFSHCACMHVTPFIVKEVAWDGIEETNAIQGLI